MSTLIGCYDKEGLRDLNNNVIIKIENASYFLRANNYLYVLSETANGDIYKVDTNSNKIVKAAKTNGAHPCHLGIIDDYIVVCNYTSGNIIGFDLDLEKIFEIQFKGNSINLSRQDAAHPHCILPIKNNQYLVTDLGSDKLILLQKDVVIKEVLLDSGSGPRHVAYHNDFYYVIGELDASITILNTNLEIIKKINVCKSFKDDMGGSAIKIKNSKMYVTIRVTNEIYVFDILDNGDLKLFKSIKSKSNWPRDLGFDTNNNLVVGFQYDNLIEIYDENLKLIEIKSNFPSPVCIGGITI